MENKKKMKTPQPINQSSGLHLVQNENLKRLLDKNPELKNEVEETENLINTKLEIQTIKQFDDILNKMFELGYISPENARSQIEKIDKSDFSNKEKLELFLSGKKFFCYWNALNNFKIKSTEQLDEMVKKAASLKLDIKRKKQELNNFKNDKDDKEMAIQIVKNVLMDFRIKTIEEFDTIVNKITALQHEIIEKTGQQNKKLHDYKDEKYTQADFDAERIYSYERMLKNFNIKTTKQFDKIIDKMNKLGFKTTQEAQEKAKKLDSLEDKTELESCLNAKKFFYYTCLLDMSLINNFGCYNDDYINLNGQDKDYDQATGLVTNNKISKSNRKLILNNIHSKEHMKLFNGISDYDDLKALFLKRIQDVSDSNIRTLLISNKFAVSIKLQCLNCLIYIRRMMVLYTSFPDPNLLLTLLSNQERYNFFLQFHKMLDESLLQEDKQLFCDYLNSCKNKLQIERNRYNYFYEREWVLTAILVFGIIASAIVLTIYFMGIYAATWFFWFGIVGVALTILVGVYLGLCIRENYNEIKPINRALKVYDLDKIRNFKESEPKKISMLANDKNENKIINGQTKGTNTDNPNNNLKLNLINTEPNKTDP